MTQEQKVLAWFLDGPRSLAQNPSGGGEFGLATSHRHQIPYIFLREVFIDGFSNSTPSRQICKRVVENFYVFSI